MSGRGGGVQPEQGCVCPTASLTGESRVAPARHLEQPLNFVQQLRRGHLESSAFLPLDSAESQ